MSTRNGRLPHDGLDLAQEAQIQRAIRDLRHLTENSPETIPWAQQIVAARAAVSTFERTGFVYMPEYANEQTFVISALQKIAYPEADSTGVADIADWCMAQWLVLLTRNPNDVDALRGLGQNWLARAQASLSRIHRQEGGSSSGSSGRPLSTNDRTGYTSSEEAREADRANVEADARAHTADYVEARGMLIPAVDFLARAVEVAEVDGRLTGNLLSEAAESLMHLGNVTYSHSNEQYFHRAVRFLRRAAQMPDFRLSPYLQR
ncbi:hypothetical protein PV08_07540 [Exophiala spinifera]|uniref:Uncharacterized protein n=1 Tax=Exophiala spinifera TaxID=91928 RepID=A0A0D1YIJ0_9EURO|nr:uncharacterized protein PV08_07540 [Exophiala spinifera]KIW14756.1 hypothetical protein PV08_07540 [Exophiala spinifera]